MAVTTRTGDAGTPTSTPPRQAGDGRGPGRTGDVGVNVFSHVVLIGWSVMVAVPFAWALLASLKTSREIFGSPWSLPAAFQWSNFARAWDKEVGEYLLNSIVVVTGGVVLTMLFGSMAAYVLARYRFPGNRLIFYLFAAGMMFPVFLAIVPLFFVVKNLGMLST
jgi:N-acetylglucosamine transport system permease protein